MMDELQATLKKAKRATNQAYSFWKDEQEGLARRRMCNVESYDEYESAYNGSQKELAALTFVAKGG